MKKLLIPLALLLTFNSCTPGSGVDPDPIDPTDSISYPCAYTVTYEITSEREWEGGYYRAGPDPNMEYSNKFPTYFTYTDSLWKDAFMARVKMERRFGDTLPMYVSVKIYFDGVLICDTSKTLRNSSAAEPLAYKFSVGSIETYRNKCN